MEWVAKSQWFNVAPAPLHPPMSSRLRFKETNQEREERVAREERKAARKKAKRGPDLQFDYENDIDERYWRLSEPTIYRTPNDVGAAYDHMREESSSKGEKDERRQTRKPAGYTQIQKELEEAKFRAKLFDAMEDDERLDSIEARFNDYRVPERWQYPSTSNSVNENPDYMEEDEYAEWVRRGMWERRHKKEMEEEERQQRLREERKAKAERDRRRQRQREDEARQKARDLASQELSKAFDSYLSAWASLANRSSNRPLRFDDIPWPMTPSPRSPEQITKEAISSFLLSASHSPNRPRKQRIRDALFLYHPDRFEKWASMMVDPEQGTMTREAAGRVVRFLNSLAEQ
ncbi:6839_t:CDS:1 [Acaulospora colombiana]|uniref:6839_t:CDS:1 n=1 Tax=Acaulospora colombiana TaxID=27376 RepID=A0ACA9MNK9_9GLOM|nr:6839_t:CDS:1 [Acaulospora colombiana]